jgi:hypothetical protein
VGRATGAIVASLLVLSTGAPEAAAQGARQSRPSCESELRRLGVEFERVKRRGIETGVLVKGGLGGVEYRQFRKQPLVIDCSLAYSLAVAGRFFAEHGIDRVTFSSAYQQRNVRGTRRPSRHSFGLAIDVHSFSGPELERITVVDDYEQGLGDEVDCIGDPLTDAGRLLRTLSCQFVRSGLFRIVLDPDYDADHYNHFHLEVLPWSQRDDWLHGEPERDPRLRSHGDSGASSGRSASIGEAERWRR